MLSNIRISSPSLYPRHRKVSLASATLMTSTDADSALRRGLCLRPQLAARSAWDPMVNGSLDRDELRHSVALPTAIDETITLRTTIVSPDPMAKGLGTTENIAIRAESPLGPTTTVNRPG